MMRTTLALLILAALPVAWRPATGRLQPASVTLIDEDFAYVRDDFYGQAAAAQIDLDDAHDSATGSGVVVAVLDGGFNLDHPIFDDRLAPNAYDAIDDDNDPDDGGNDEDDDGDDVVDGGVGHGNFVAGMVLLAAPDAEILAIRVADDEGRVDTEDLARGLRHAIKEKADVINLSMALPESGREDVEKLLDLADKKGIVIVVSAGNDGSSTLGWLARNEHTIAVGAVDGDDEIPTFSNGGDSEDVDVLAPGVKLEGPLGWPDEDSMAIGTGTSFSAGIVSGAVALYLELNGGADVDDVREAIAESVDPVGCDDDSDGPGRINLEEVTQR